MSQSECSQVHGYTIIKRCQNCARFPMCPYQLDCFIHKDFDDSIVHYKQVKNYWVKRKG